jgi:hypothetical protein
MGTKCLTFCKPSWGKDAINYYSLEPPQVPTLWVCKVWKQIKNMFSVLLPFPFIFQTMCMFYTKQHTITHSNNNSNKYCAIAASVVAGKLPKQVEHSADWENSLISLRPKIHSSVPRVHHRKNFTSLVYNQISVFSYRK